MKKLGLVLCSFLFATIALFAWEWPLKNPWIAFDFASDHGGVFFPGVSLGSAETLVRAVDAGELVFYTEGMGNNFRAFPVLVRGSLVIQHPEGFRSVYRGLVPSSVHDFSVKAETNKYQIKQNEIIGVLPQRPDGKDESLFFQFLDYREGGSVNPALLLPLLPDERLPVITAISIVPSGSSERIPLSERMEINASRFQLYVQLRDILGMRDNRLPSTIAGLPQDIRVLWNGTLQYNSQKLSLRMNPDNPRELVLSRNPFGAFGIIHPDDSMIYMGEYNLVDGINRLEMRASDLQGNRASASYRIFHPPKITALP